MASDDGESAPRFSHAHDHIVARKILDAWHLVRAVLFGFDGCKKTISEHDFVGKWQSSRAVTPIHLAATGEWEIRQDDGTVLQYGLWRYEEKQIIWNVMQAGRLVSDRNPVLLVAPMQFHLKEADGAVTVFRRLP